jgi:hypothetical protein
MGEGAQLSTQNMLIRDNNSGYMDERGATMDHTRNMGFVQDVQLSDFFSRPIKIAEYSWGISTPLFERLNPWSLFWDNARNIEKLKNYNLLKCTLRVKFLLNGNAFYYGRAIAAYEPLPGLDSAAVTRNWLDQDFVRGSQRMHVYLNPTCSQGGSLELPFFYPDNALSIPSRDWQDLGDIVLASLTELQHANGGTEPVFITILAWAENVTYAIPTGNIPEMADEHNVNIISRPASAVSRFAGSLTNVPWIGPFALATQIGAGAVSSIAKIFGYSAPNELSYNVIVPSARHSLAVVDTKQATNKLTVDSKQELTLDATTTGIFGTDELPIGSIAGRETYLTNFPWIVTTDAPDKLLFSCRVDPGLFRTNASEFHLTACCMAVLPFDYWRGTMRFRFQLVSSEYHKGRIRIVYDPNESGTSAEYNTHYTTVHDIADEKDFTIDVGWGQKEPYREHIALDNTGTHFGAVPIASDPFIGNGTISVYVLNPLATAGTVVSSINVNVFVSALDDFEVASPNNELTHVRFNVPQMDEDADNCEDPITDPPVAATMADVMLDDPDTTKLFFGEVIGSYRQLLKRTYHHETSIMPETTSIQSATFNRSAFPLQGGYLTYAPANSAAVVQGVLNYLPYETTMLNYISKAFLGWRGSIRWTIDYGSRNTASADVVLGSTVSHSRVNKSQNNNSQIQLASSLTSNMANLLNEAERGDTARGLYIGNTDVNPIMSFEVPFYSNQRFLSTQDEPVIGTSTNAPAFKVNMLLQPSTDANSFAFFKTFCSAGEDFNLFFFNGMPICYYETIYPVPV